MPTDFAIGVRELLGEGVQYRRSSTYAELVATWEDAATVPSEAALDAAYTAWAANEATYAPIKAYIKAFMAERRTLFMAYYTFSEAFRTASASPSLAQYQSALQSTLDIIDDLPSTFTTELAREQAGQALPDEPASGWTAVQCRGWHTLLGHWLGRAMAGVAGAMIEEGNN